MSPVPDSAVPSEAFQPPGDDLKAPEAGSVHVWKADLELPENLREGLREILAPDERERADAFVFDRDRFHYIAGRGQLRLLLGAYLGRPPASIAFSYNREGRPDLKAPAGDESGALFFNLSHSMGRAVYAFSREKRTGIDVEIPRNREVDYRGIVDYFSPAEQTHLRALSPERLPDEFLRFWTGKEAVLKAIGSGLSAELSSLEIEARPEGLRTVLVQKQREEAALWRLFELRPFAEGRCTLAIRRTGSVACRPLSLETDTVRSWL